MLTSPSKRAVRGLSHPLRSLALISAVAVAALLGTPASAQTPSVLYQRVRVTTANAGREVRHVGVATSLAADTLVVAGEGLARAVPVGAIHRLEISRGRRGRSLLGALVGAGIGLGVGLSTVGRDDAGVGVVVVPLSTGFYAGLGALVGLAFRTERWEAVPAEQFQGR